MAAVLLASGCAGPKTDLTFTVDAVGDFTTTPDTATVNLDVTITYPGACDGRSFECSELGADPERSTFNAGPKGALTKLSPVSDPPSWQGTITGYGSLWGIEATFEGTSYVGATEGKAPWPSPSLTMEPLHANQPATISWTKAVTPVPNESDHGSVVVTSMATSAPTFSSKESDVPVNGILNIPPSAFPEAGSYEIRFRRETTLNLKLDPSLDLSTAKFTVELTTQIDVAP